MSTRHDETLSEAFELTKADVLFEDDYLLAVNKPPGMVSHPCYKHLDGTLFDALVCYFRGTGVHPHLLQRLDKHTSGVLLVSKSPIAHARVVRAMGKPAFSKNYLAVVWGRPEPPDGEIALRLQRDASDTRRVTASATEGKECLTVYRTLATSMAGDEPGAEVSLVQCELLTGRMHQARVHLAARGWPIVGDSVYAKRPAAGLPPVVEQFPRQALHAWRVAFAHPMTRETLVITAPVPADMRALMLQVGLPIPAERL